MSEAATLPTAPQPRPKELEFCLLSEHLVAVLSHLTFLKTFDFALKMFKVKLLSHRDMRRHTHAHKHTHTRTHKHTQTHNSTSPNKLKKHGGVGNVLYRLVFEWIILFSIFRNGIGKIQNLLLMPFLFETNKNRHLPPFLCFFFAARSRFFHFIRTV